MAAKNKKSDKRLSKKERDALERKSNRNWIIITGVLTVIVATLVVVFFVRYQKRERSGETYDIQTSEENDTELVELLDSLADQD